MCFLTGRKKWSETSTAGAETVGHSSISFGQELAIMLPPFANNLEKVIKRNADKGTNFPLEFHKILLERSHVGTLFSFFFGGWLANREANGGSGAQGRSAGAACGKHLIGWILEYIKDKHNGLMETYERLFATIPNYQSLRIFLKGMVRQTPIL